MPLPTAAELTDPNATNTQMKQRLGQLAEGVVSKDAIDSKLNFVNALPPEHQFIKELYITGWNGTDELYLMIFDADDAGSGKVSFQIKNKTTNRLVIYSYRKDRNLPIYVLGNEGEAAGSGFSGYIVVDWKAYTSRVHSQGGYLYPVSKKALDIVNCPYVKNYILENSVKNLSDKSTALPIFIDGLSNHFIKELYITGWNGTDELYLMQINGNDSGGVTIEIKNKTTNSTVLYSFKKPQNQPIYQLMTEGSAVGSGFGGYIVIDWTSYALLHSQGGYLYKINRKAQSLANSPYIYDYLNKQELSASLSTVSQTLSTNINVYNKALDASATHPFKGLINQLIPDIKLLSGHTSGFKYFIRSIDLIENGLRIQIQYYNPSNPGQANPWASYNVDLIRKTVSVDTYDFQYGSYVWRVKIDWNYYSQITATTVNSGNVGTLEKTLLNEQMLFAKSFDSDGLIKSNNEVTYLISKPHNVIKDVRWGFRANKPNYSVAGN